jgi:hypothetical protein
MELAAAEKLWWVLRQGNKVRAHRHLPPGDPDFERALRDRDPTDLPTVTLASLIGPVVVPATDPDLKDIGLAYERWREVLEAIRKVVAVRGSTDLAARAIFGAGYGTVALIRGAARALHNP